MKPGFPILLSLILYVERSENMKKKTIIGSINLVVIVAIIIFTGCIEEKSPAPVSTEKSEVTQSVSELLESPVYDTEVKVYGIVNHLGQLFCPCFTLYSDRKMLDVQYDMMWEDDGTKRPAVNVEGIENGNWVIVTGELRSSTGTAPSTTFWASNIEKIDAPLAPFSSLQDCQSGCVEAGFERGECKLPTEVELPYFILGPCVIPSSEHCQNEGQCNCYCYNLTQSKPDIKEEEAPIK